MSEAFKCDICGEFTSGHPTNDAGIAKEVTVDGTSMKLSVRIVNSGRYVSVFDICDKCKKVIVLKF